MHSERVKVGTAHPLVSASHAALCQEALLAAVKELERGAGGLSAWQLHAVDVFAAKFLPVLQRAFPGRKSGLDWVPLAGIEERALDIAAWDRLRERGIADETLSWVVDVPVPTQPFPKYERHLKEYLQRRAMLDLLDDVLWVQRPNPLSATIEVVPDDIRLELEYRELLLLGAPSYIQDLLRRHEPCSRGAAEGIQEYAEKVLRRLPELWLPTERRLRILFRMAEALASRWREDYSELRAIGDATLIATMQVASEALHEDPVLILGPSGTGKELAARAIHALSRRRQGPFRVANLGGLSSELAASELFGHLRGAFTGAVMRHHGLFERSEQGTLFLDEIGDASPLVQVQLLRVLSEGTIRPVGSSEEVEVNVRVVCATNRNLEELVSQGKFREDLYYRLRGSWAIRLPPLAKRSPEDVQAIWETLTHKAHQELPHTPSRTCLQRLGKDGRIIEVIEAEELVSQVDEDEIDEKVDLEIDAPGSPGPKADKLDSEEIEALVARCERGNIRELEHLAREFARWKTVSMNSSVAEILDFLSRVQAGPRSITSDQQPSAPGPIGLDEVLDWIQKNLLDTALGEADGDFTHAAKRLGLTEAALRKRHLRLGKRLRSAKAR